MIVAHAVLFAENEGVLSHEAEVLCVVGRREFTILELAQQIVEITGSSSKILFEPLPMDDPAQRKPAITLARSKFGWEPNIDLQEGLVRTIDYFCSLELNPQKGI